MNKTNKMETVKITLSFEYDKATVCAAVNGILSQLKLPLMSEKEIMNRFCKEEPTIITTELTEDINLLGTYICLMIAANKQKLDD